MFGHSSAIVIGASSSQKELARDVLINMNFIYVHTPEEISDAKKLLSEDLDAPLIIFWDSIQSKAQIILESLDEIDGISLRKKIIVNTNKDEDFSELWSELQLTEYIIEQFTEKLLIHSMQENEKYSQDQAKLYSCLQQASEKLILGDHQKAVTYLTAFHEEDEAFDIAMLHAGYILLYHKQADEAIKLLSPMRDQYQSNPRYLDLLGKCYLSIKEFSQAVRYFERALEQNSHHVTRRVNLAKALLYAGHYHKALDIYGSIQNPSVISLVLPGKVKSLLLLGQNDKALELLEETDDQQVASMLNVAAVMAINHGFHERGLELFAMSARLLKSDWASLSKFGFNMGIAYFRQKDFENAGRCFGLAAALDPDNDRARENYSMLSDLVSIDDIPEERSEALEALARYSRSA